MKINVLLSSEKYLMSAGNRIRYRRLASHLKKFGSSVEITTIDNADSIKSFDGNDVFLFSKVQDARGIILAHALRRKGCRVGIDLFDDYFSQVGDARFSQQRGWLRDMVGTSDFFICSTETMKRIAERYFGDVPGHILQDPFDHFDRDRLSRLLEAKRQAAVAAKEIRVLWFGMGDNPNFPVGLHDLEHYGYALESFRTRGFRVRLKVLTNARALDGTGLARLRRLPVCPDVEEWSEEREKAALEESLVSFLPVNAQDFSIAKSLNRAVTALTGGTQLLSAGYPLYRPLDDFLYRDAEALADDLLSGALRVSADRLDALVRQLERISSPVAEAGALHRFLDSVPRLVARSMPSGEMAVLHGQRSTGAIHKFARQRGWLSLGSPYTPAGLSYDAHVTIFGVDEQPALRVSASAAKLLSTRIAARARPLKSGEGFVLELPPDAFCQDGDSALFHALKACGNSGAQIALHPVIMKTTRRIYTQLFGPLHFVESELAPLLCQDRNLDGHSAWMQS